VVGVVTANVAVPLANPSTKHQELYNIADMQKTFQLTLMREHRTSEIVLLKSKLMEEH
jgi:hypothetical protein